MEETFESVKKSILDACKLALKQPIPGKQLVLMTDAIFQSAGFAFIIEDNPDQKIHSKRKTYTTLASGTKFSPPRNTRCPSTQKKIWRLPWHFLSLRTFSKKHQSQHLIWQISKITNLSHVSSKRKQIHQYRWMHLAMKCNSTSIETNILSRLKLKATLNLPLKIRENIQGTPIELTTSSSDVTDDENILAHTESEEVSEVRTLERQEQSLQNAKQWVANEEAPSSKTSVK